MAKKMLTISLPLPGTERNRMRLKAPRTATPVPKLPLTIMMTACTRTGRRASVMAKLLVQLLRKV